MPKSFLDVQGLYNPSLRFAFTNITTEAFTSYWNGVPIVIKAGETIEISNITPIPGAGHAIAVKMTGEMVDKIMMDEAKMDEIRVNTPYYRSPKGTSLGVPAARKPIEDQILRELSPEEESPAIQTIRKQLLEEIQAGGDEKQTTAPVHIPTSIEEFADINNVSKEPAIERPAKVKKLGRPRKNEVAISSAN